MHLETHNTLIIMKKRCLQCQSPVFGRIDKKFCSTECRVQYHNTKNKKDNRYILQVNKFLRQNRSILQQLYDDHVKKISQSQLLKLGFKPEYCTNIYQTKNQKKYYFTYDFGILPLSSDYYAVVKRKEYLR